MRFASNCTRALSGPAQSGRIPFGAVWAFVNGLVAGLLIAWFDNRFLLTRRRTLS